MKTLESIVKERILVLDGAMGTMIQRYGLSESDYRGERFSAMDVPQKGNNDLLTLTCPHVIEEIHRKYLEAGADIIETNTFSSQRISMADYQCEEICRELNLTAARLARRLADEFTERTPFKPRFVAGSIGPTNKTCSMSPDVSNPAYRALTFDVLKYVYLEQIEALLEGGVDALLIETIFDTLNAKAALCAADKAMKNVGRMVPIMLSVTVADKSGRTLSGQTLSAFLASVSHRPVFSVGLNCSFGAADMKPFLHELSQQSPFYISAYPNAGLPNDLGQYVQTPEVMAEQVKNFVKEGLVNIVGGCCGTTNLHIKAIHDALVADEELMAHTHQKKPVRTDLLRLSGLDALDISPEQNFIVIGERCNVAGSRKFLRLITEKKYDEAVGVARQQVESGAQILDINIDDGLLNTKEEMVHFLHLLSADPEVARCPFMIDSSKWEVIEEALKCVQGKCIVNSISLKEGETTFLARAQRIKEMGAAVVVMAFDEEGQAVTYERRIGICERAYRLLVDKVGYAPQDIIFDPNILAICTGIPEHNSYALDFIRTTKWIREHLPGAHVVGGVSNLSFSFRGNNYLREAMHTVFLHHAIQAGMEMGIVNPNTSLSYADIPQDLREMLDDVILNRKDVLAELLTYAERYTNALPTSPTMSENQLQEDVESRLKRALIKGDDTHLEDDLTEALSKYTKAIDIIEGPLMSAMDEVGELFGEGRMFLPQVVKTARTMKKAVSVLQPYLLSDNEKKPSRGRVLLATVKGDVHDIGKNIVSVILGCNNYEVIDLGVMCPATTIVETAIKENVDFIGLSGLITPSLDEMVNIARQMQQAGMNIPLLLGGATTSKQHTALKIATEYHGPVVWVSDASKVVGVMARLGNEKTKAEFLQQLTVEYAAIRQKQQEQDCGLSSLEESRKKRLKLFE